MKKYVIPQNRKIQRRNLLAFKGEGQKIQYDFAPWEAENGTVTTVTWSIISGQASISSETLASSKASAIVTTTEPGRSIIEIKALTDEGLTMVTNLRVTSLDNHECETPLDYRYH